MTFNTNTAQKSKAKKPTSPKAQAKPAAEKKPRAAKKAGEAGAEDRKRMPPLVDLMRQAFVLPRRRGQPLIETPTRCTLVGAASHDCAVTISTKTQELIEKETVGSMRTALSGAIICQLMYLLETQQLLIHDPGKGPQCGRGNATIPDSTRFTYLKWNDLKKVESIQKLYQNFEDFPVILAANGILNRGSFGTHTSVIGMPEWVLTTLETVSGCGQRLSLSLLAESFFARLLQTGQCLQIVKVEPDLA